MQKMTVEADDEQQAIARAREFIQREFEIDEEDIVLDIVSFEY